MPFKVNNPCELPTAFCLNKDKCGRYIGLGLSNLIPVRISTHKGCATQGRAGLGLCVSCGVGEECCVKCITSA